MNRFVSLLVLIALLVLQAACSTTTTTEQKQADMAGKTDSTQRAAIHTERAAEYYRLGSMAVALEAAKQSVAAQSSYAPAHNMLALIYMELREDSKAQASFEQAIRLAPNFSDALNNYGWFICQRLTPQRSLPYFEQAIRDPLYTTPHRAHYNAGVCARKAGDMKASEVNLRASLQRAPEFAAALYELADLSYALGRIKEADVVFSRYTKSVRDPDANGLLLGVRISRDTGDRNAEAGYLSQLRRRFPDSVQTRDAIAGLAQ
ncbi:MAG: type IV pilus biogenesis/stability protein PilW [Aeromicrobium sp.]|nr:type IV pilus biogenesis/stability protein PilW [Burkholderiales bacterium]